MRGVLTLSDFILTVSARPTVFGNAWCEILESSAASLEVGDSLLWVARLKKEMVVRYTPAVEIFTYYERQEVS